jgi:hypothetical protein
MVEHAHTLSRNVRMPKRMYTYKYVHMYIFIYGACMLFFSLGYSEPSSGL